MGRGLERWIEAGSEGDVENAWMKRDRQEMGDKKGLWAWSRHPE